jgi:ribosomal protein S18 acetylase RimI-like enzyme
METAVNITRRPVTPADAGFLYTLYAGTREEEMALTGWSPKERETFLQMQFQAQTVDYARHYPDAQRDLVLGDGRPAGRLYLHRRADEIRILDITLNPEYRNRGIGTQLLSELQAEAAAAGKAVRIHVEVNNPARSLYNRMGFSPVSEHGIYLLLEWGLTGTGVTADDPPVSCGNEVAA